MLSALGTDKDKVKTILGGLSESDSFVMATVFALNILATRKSRVLDAFRIDMQVLSASGVVCPVDTVIDFITFSSSLVVVTHVAVELQASTLTFTVFKRLKHVVTVRAESHSLELGRIFYLSLVLLSSNHFNIKL